MAIPLTYCLATRSAPAAPAVLEGVYKGATGIAPLLSAGMFQATIGPKRGPRAVNTGGEALRTAR